MDRPIVGVLALQGAFAKHVAMLRTLGATPIEVRKPEDLDSCEGLIIPGGESTVIYHQIQFIHLLDKLQEFAEKKPIFGTCAGLILMSQKVIADSIQPLGVLDISVERNAFGRQAESFSTTIEIQLESKKKQLFPAIFIRAPRIRVYSPQVKVLSFFEEEAVLVQQGFHLGATFHPELTDNVCIHEYFIHLIQSSRLV